MTNHERRYFPITADGPPAKTESPPQLVTSLCGGGTCPTVYSTGRDTLIVQGKQVTGLDVPDGEMLVEIPRELLLEAARRLQEQGG